MLYSHRVSFEWLRETALIFMSTSFNQLENIFEKFFEFVPPSSISQNYQIVARDLDILQPKTPEEVYKEKSHGFYTVNSLNDGTRLVVANTVVSGFVNAGYSSDKILTIPEPEWQSKLMDSSCLSAVACIGLVYLWDMDEGLLAIDKYLYSSDLFVKAGAYVACGLLSTGNPEAGDTALAILSSALTSNTSRQEKMASIISLGLSMAGTNNTVALDMLDEIFQTYSTQYADIEMISTYAIAVGMIALGSKRQREVVNLSGYLHAMKDKLVVKDVTSSYVVIGFCLLYFGTQSLDDIIPSFSIFPDSLKSYLTVMLNGFAYAGSGNVAVIEELLLICHQTSIIEDEKLGEISEETTQKESETNTKKQKKKYTSPSEIEITDKHVIASTAALGIAAIGINDDNGISMCFRLFNNILQYGTRFLRRIVPMCLAVLSASNPQVLFIDTLSKLSHDNDTITSCNAILALGIIGAGTNNAKIASLLRQLSGFFYKDPVNIFATKLSIGLLHSGKGMISLSPLRANKSLVSNVSLASLLLFGLACIDCRSRILSNEYYLFFWLACAMKPRYLMTYDENGEHINIPVRVGQV